MGLSNLPPGHPTGMVDTEGDWACEFCGHENYVSLIDDRETGTCDLANDDDRCEECDAYLEDGSEPSAEWVAENTDENGERI